MCVTWGLWTGTSLYSLKAGGRKASKRGVFPWWLHQDRQHPNSTSPSLTENKGFFSNNKCGLQLSFPHCHPHSSLCSLSFLLLILLPPSASSLEEVVSHFSLIYIDIRAIIIIRYSIYPTYLPFFFFGYVLAVRVSGNNTHGKLYESSSKYIQVTWRKLEGKETLTISHHSIMMIVIVIVFFL